MSNGNILVTGEPYSKPDELDKRAKSIVGLFRLLAENAAMRKLVDSKVVHADKNLISLLAASQTELENTLFAAIRQLL